MLGTMTNPEVYILILAIAALLAAVSFLYNKFSHLLFSSQKCDDSFFEALITSLVAISAADKEVRESEIQKIQAAVKELTDQDISTEKLMTCCHATKREDYPLDDRMGRLRKYISPSKRAAILSAAIDVVLADNVVADEEVMTFYSIATDLGFSKRQIKAHITQAKALTKTNKPTLSEPPTFPTQVKAA